jgi:hypothetical protein
MELSGLSRADALFLFSSAMASLKRFISARTIIARCA